MSEQEPKIEKELNQEELLQKLTELSERMISFHEEHIGLQDTKLFADFKKIQEELEDCREMLM